MKGICSIFMLLAACSAAGQEIGSVFPKKWQVSVGQTTFRTNITFNGNSIYVPSNGSTRNTPGDAQDGVHVINPISGKTEKVLRNSSDDVFDVNGVVLDGEKLFFTCDDGFLYCYSTAGEYQWAVYGRQDLQEITEDTPDDLEGVPVLSDLDKDGTNDVVFNVEGYGLVAVSGIDGNRIWEFVFPWGHGSYMNSPAVFDVNKDGFDDFIIGAKREPDPEQNWDYQNSAFAINGKNGKPIWQYQTGSNIHASPLVLVTPEKTNVVITESYSTVHFLRPDGKMESYLNLNEPGGGISGLFATPAFTAETMVLGTSWWGSDDGVWTAKYHHADKIVSDFELQGDSRDVTYTLTDRVSASAVVADVLKEKGLEILVPTEKGELLVFNETGSLLHRLLMPAGSECTPLVADIDGDKKLDILIADYNGNLTCYAGNKKKGKVLSGSFRGGGNNSGVIRMD